ncbi:MAG TPA: hypothetical protein VF807_13540 [Ktedonobacterales bacterium]
MRQLHRVWRVAVALALAAVLMTAAPTIRGAHAGSGAAMRDAHQHANERALAAGPLTYHGGPVQRNPVSYLIFWGSSWDIGSGSLTPDGSIAQAYFQDVSGSSYLKTLTQYSDATGAISATHTLGGTWIDPVAPTTDTSCGSATTEDSAIQAEVSRAISVKGWPQDGTNATYYVITQPGVTVNDGHGACAQRHFCDYHDWSTAAGVAYAVIPYPTDLTACGVPATPHGNTPGDSLASLAAQAQFGAITDPHVGSGWLDAAGNEIGLKCQWDFSQSPITLANGGVFELQSAFSNTTASCVAGYGAHIQASPAAIGLTVIAPEGNPAPQTLTLTNTGNAPMDWSLTSSLPAWLSLDATSGTIAPGGSRGLTATFSMPAGTTTQSYTTTLTFAGPSADNSPVGVPVTVVVASVATTWYFAEGYTGGSFSEFLTLANPTSLSAHVSVDYLLGAGAPLTKSYTVGPNSRFTPYINAEVGPGQNVSMVVHSDVPIVAERPMYFTYTGLPGASIPGGSDVLGATSLGQTYDFGYLDTSAGHDTWLTVLNPQSTPTTVTVSYFPASGGAPLVRQSTAPATSRFTLHVNSDAGLAPGSYSALVQLSQPGFVERPLYLVDSQTGWTGAADVIGVSAPRSSWYFAEGYTNTNFVERYILANPTSGTASVTLQLLTTDGKQVSTSLQLGPGQQQVVSVNGLLGSTGVSNSAVVSATGAPILAERFMSFAYNGPVGTVASSFIPGATDVLGTSGPSTLFLFAEGYSGGSLGSG